MAENVLEEALRITGGAGERRRDYGSALADAERVAQIASAITGFPIRAEHIPLIMVAVKLSRQVNRPKRDNLVDIAGYARVAELLWEEKDDVDDIHKAIREAA
jgi:hypothetical protein